MEAKSARFPRQLDQNGLYHSVCMTCFRTITISSDLAALSENEWRHNCNGGLSKVGPRSAQGTEQGRHLQAK